jgi:hypothetical protein
MKTFFDDYFTKGLIALVVLVNAAAILLKIDTTVLDSFNLLAGSLIGVNASKSVLHDFAAGYQAKHSQPTQTTATP